MHFSIWTVLHRIRLTRCSPYILSLRGKVSLRSRTNSTTIADECLIRVTKREDVTPGCHCLKIHPITGYSMVLIRSDMSLFEPITLTTQRLKLRPIRHDDVHAFFEIWSDAETMRYFSFPIMTGIDQATDRMAHLLKTSADGKELVLAMDMLATGAVLGHFALCRLNEQCRRTEINYCLNRKYWGSGYMAEAASALIAHAFDTLNLNRIEADIDARNLASARLLERLGFIREGLLRERWIVADEVSDSVIYGLLASDYWAKAN
jgi:RimJ/RimL family protein N-acetyltransferase